ncbi:hypothetical protein BKE23_09275 [Listeria monocytogenes]|nr:hypothetical protein [Listeria monocytogenes]EAC4260826.1 hypothetical protein [Listeria monocytogenes]EAE7323088.1 hypothetical protein [Listeria monocytogenes]EAW7174516.1 hypothetical protein [Listeria monocytogenes]EBD1590245.1 hypothetical protein [Listeria monocytogenes]
MKLKVYKAKYAFDEIHESLLEFQYKQIGGTKKFKDTKVSISLFFDLHKKSIPDWVEELLLFFNSENFFETEVPNQYNAIMVIQTEKSTYLLPKGHAFWVVEKLANLDFGLDFAEKTIKSKDILLKSVSYIQRNKMRGITNYKKDQNEFPQASESYFYVSGKPEMENIFGASVDCGTGITFGENYDLGEEVRVEKFCQLFNEIDIALRLKGKKSTIPRLHKVSKKDEKYKELNTSLLNDLKADSNKSQLLLNINRIQLIGNGISILENEKKLSIYISGKKRKKEKDIEINGTKIIEYIKKNDNIISSIEQIKFALYNEEGICIKKEIPFSQLVYCEIQLDSTLYVLDNGNWGFFNERFYELLEEKLLEIDEKVVFENDFSIEYDSYESGEFSGEGGYIEEISKRDHLIKLHKRNLSVSGTAIEVADIYDQKKDELFAIKRGTGTSLAMYSFEQSLLSVQILANKKEFKVEEELLKYNNRKNYKNAKKYPNIRENNVKNITACKNISVLWLVDKKKKYIFDGITFQCFKLKDFKSIMLKLKIIDWYSFTKDHGYNPKLYFAIDNPRKK